MVLGTAVIEKVTPVAIGHIEPNAFEVIEPGEAGLLVNTVIGMLLLVTVVGDAHVAFEVTVTVMLEPVASEVVVKVELVAPAILFPLFFH